MKRKGASLLAFSFAVLFVLTAVPTLLLYDLARLTTDRAAMKELLSSELFDDAEIRSTIVEQLRSQTIVGYLPSSLQDAVLSQDNLDAVYNSDWASQQRSVLVDAVYDYLETGDESKLVARFDTGRLLAALRGELGQRIISQSLEGLPVCTGSLPEITLDNGRLNLPTCLPPFVPTELLADQLHAILMQIIDSNPLGIASGGEIRFNLLDLAGARRAELLVNLQRLHQAYLWAQRAWLLGFIPLVCLAMIALLVVRTPDGLAFWWGFPLATAGLFSLTVALGGPSVFAMSGESLVARWLPDLLAPEFVIAVMDDLLSSLGDAWFTNLQRQSAAILVIGVALILAGLVLRWMLAPRSPANS